MGEKVEYLTGDRNTTVDTEVGDGPLYLVVFNPPRVPRERC